MSISMKRDRVIAYYRYELGEEPPKEVLDAPQNTIFSWGFTITSRGMGSAPLHRSGYVTEDGISVFDFETEEEARETDKAFREMAEEREREHKLLSTMTPEDQKKYLDEKNRKFKQKEKELEEEWNALPEEEQRRRLQACEDLLHEKDDLEIYDGISLHPSMRGLQKLPRRARRRVSGEKTRRRRYPVNGGTIESLTRTRPTSRRSQ